MCARLLDGTISKEDYDNKNIEFTRKLHGLYEKRLLLNEMIRKRKNVGKRMEQLRESLSSRLRRISLCWKLEKTE